MDIPYTLPLTTHHSNSCMKKHQIKSGWYYLFWGLATVSVVLGQVYVGTGYRQMAGSIEKVITQISKTAD